MFAFLPEAVKRSVNSALTNVGQPTLTPTPPPGLFSWGVFSVDPR